MVVVCVCVCLCVARVVERSMSIDRRLIWFDACAMLSNMNEKSERNMNISNSVTLNAINIRISIPFHRTMAHSEGSDHDPMLDICTNLHTYSTMIDSTNTSRCKIHTRKKCHLPNPSSMPDLF